MRAWRVSYAGSADTLGRGVFARRNIDSDAVIWSEAVVSVAAQPHVIGARGHGPDDHHLVLDEVSNRWIVLRDSSGCAVTTTWYLNSSQDSGVPANAKLELNALGTVLTVRAREDISAGTELLWSYRR